MGDQSLADHHLELVHQLIRWTGPIEDELSPIATRCDELLVHRTNGGHVLLKDTLDAPSALLDISANSTNQANIIGCIHIDNETRGANEPLTL